jgi:hypothetical protein
MSHKIILAFVFLLTLPLYGCEKDDNIAAPAQAEMPRTEPVATPAAVYVPMPVSALPVLQPPLTPATTNVAKQADVQVYKCKTAQGVTFSDAPCGENQEQLSVRETSVIDNAGLREKAAQWEHQDAVDAENQLATRAAASKQASLANRCFDGNGQQVDCGNRHSEEVQYSQPWYGDPKYNPYYNPYNSRYGGYPNRHHDGRYRDTIPASKDGRYDARDRVIESRFQDPSRTIKQHLGIDGQ